jgi:hypothetical protein
MGPHGRSGDGPRLFVCTDEADRTTMADLLDRYTRDVSPTKRSGGSDKGRAEKLKKQLGAYKLTALTSSHLVGYRDARLKEVSPQTVIHELNLLNRALTLATREWGIVLPAGIPKVIKPRKPQGRPIGSFTRTRFRPSSTRRNRPTCGTSSGSP